MIVNVQILTERLITTSTMRMIHTKTLQMITKMAMLTMVTMVMLVMLVMMLVTMMTEGVSWHHREVVTKTLTALSLGLK